MFSIQPTLENEAVKLQPLKEEDFEILYEVASDALIWEQHPDKGRWKREAFQNYFEGAILSKSAFLILDKASNEVVGSTRFYNYNEEDKSIFIGYTFYGRKFWGNGYNFQIKKLMLDYIFQFVDVVKFEAGPENHRSRKAMEKIGCVFQGTFTKPDGKKYVEYWVKKEDWV